MNRTRSRLFLLTLTAATGVALLEFGCGGDDTTLAPSVDASTTDGTTADGPGVDATFDASNDARPTPDAGDAMPGDAMPGDAATIDAPAVADFPHEANVTFCKRLESCCLLTDSTWDQAKCVATYDRSPGIGRVGQWRVAIDAGDVTYDASAAVSCLQEIAALPCGVFTSAQVVQLKQDCNGALAATLASGQPCTDSHECGLGLWCGPTADAGTTCQPLLDAGASCVFSQAGSATCTYLGLGTNPPAYCNYHNPDGGGITPNGTCSIDLQPVDAGCVVDEECQSGHCVGHCTDTFVLSDPGIPNGVCAYFTAQDAGPTDAGGGG